MPLSEIMPSEDMLFLLANEEKLEEGYSGRFIAIWKKDVVAAGRTVSEVYKTAKGKKMAKELMQKHKTLAEFLEIIGVEREDADIDACQIEHHVSLGTMKQLNKFVVFVREAPRDPKWLEHFKQFCKTGKRPDCVEERGG